MDIIKTKESLNKFLLSAGMLILTIFSGAAQSWSGLIKDFGSPNNTLVMKLESFYMIRDGKKSPTFSASQQNGNNGEIWMLIVNSQNNKITLSQISTQDGTVIMTGHLSQSVPSKLFITSRYIDNNGIQNLQDCKYEIKLTSVIKESNGVYKIMTSDSMGVYRDFFAHGIDAVAEFILQTAHGINPDLTDIKLNDQLSKDLGFDELDVIDFIIQIETLFNIKISDEESESATTLNDYVNIVKKHI